MGETYLLPLNEKQEDLQATGTDDENNLQPDARNGPSNVTRNVAPMSRRQFTDNDKKTVSDIKALSHNSSIDEEKGLTNRRLRVQSGKQERWLSGLKRQIANLF